MVVTTREELKFFMLADMMMNKRTFKYSIRQRFETFLSPDYVIQYLQAMRKTSFHKFKVSHLLQIKNSKCGVRCLFSIVYHFMCYALNYSRFSRLGVKLGFSIGYNTLGYGVWIPHHGTIIVGDSNRLGNFACLHSSICITSTGKTIGENCFIGTGAKLISHFDLGNNVQVGANSVVNKTFKDKVCLVGSPATVKKLVDDPWWKDSNLEQCVKSIIQLKREMNLNI